MNKYAKDDKGNIPKKNDHLIDCFRYFNGLAYYNMNEVIEAVKIQYDSGDGWKEVDDGFTFNANYDKHSLVKIFFEKPVRTNSIRIYPQSWNGHASGRFGILRGDDSLEIPVESPSPSAAGPSSTEDYRIMGYKFE
mgnify:CR=1 FL=1